jgi:hypothetical protein
MNRLEGERRGEEEVEGWKEISLLSRYGRVGGSRRKEGGRREEENFCHAHVTRAWTFPKMENRYLLLIVGTTFSFLIWTITDK